MSPEEAIRRGYRVVVPNQRLEQYWTEQALKKHAGFHGSPVFSYRSLIEFYFKKLPQSSLYRILSDSQAIIWLAQLFFSNDIGSAQIKYAQSFYKGYQRLKRWKISPEKMTYYFLNFSQKIFLDKIYALEKAKNRENILFQEDLSEALFNADFSLLNISSHPPLYWIGFDDWTPLQKDIQHMLSRLSQDSRVEPDLNDSNIVSNKKCFLSFDDELNAALDWLKNQPQDKRCAIVVPDLQDCYKFFKNRALSRLDYELSRLPLAQVSSNFGISHGQSLSEHPIIHDLMHVLSGLSDMPYSVNPDLWANQFHPSQYPSRLNVWMDWLLDLLNATHWLDEMRLTSEEYQAGQAFWKECMGLKNISNLYAPMSWRSFVQILQGSLTLSIFQAQSLNSHHMIIGLLEASALPWDAVWLCHADSFRFPQSLMKHPLIPDLLQHHHDFPHSSYERESAYLHKILVRIFSQSDENVISYASNTKNGQASPSFIIEDIAKGPYITVDSSVKIRLSSIAFMPKSRSLQQGSLSVSQIDAFAQCPFQGWAKTLANSQPNFSSPPLFDPRLYGNFIHQNLQNYIQTQTMHSFLPHQWTERLAAQESSRLTMFQKKIKQDLGPELSDWEIEVPIVMSIAGWKIRGRIDLYNPKTQSIIDIKTRSLSLNMWASTQSVSWQGAIYVLATQSQNLGLICVANNTLTINQKNIAQQIPIWQESLKNILEQWSQGLYPPAPVNLQVCRTCQYQSSCRYHLISPDLHETRS
jgi:RecB family exonuclease